MVTPPWKPLAVNLTLILTFSRPLLVFMAFFTSLWLLSSQQPAPFLLSWFFLLGAMVVDWAHGWLAPRFIPASRMSPVMDRMMDRLTFSIIFPVLAVGVFWRYGRLTHLPEDALRLERLHAVFVLGLCVVVLMRDHLVQFLRNLAMRGAEHSESYPLSRLRTLFFSPLAVLLYGYTFQQDEWNLPSWAAWVEQLRLLPLNVLLVLEIVFLIIAISSATLHLRKYGTLILDDIAEDDQQLRHKILAIVPNFLSMMNGVLGVSAVWFASQGRMREAVFILIGATLCDHLDGFMARRLGLVEPLATKEDRAPHLKMGPIIDDVADAISFSLAPALMMLFYLKPFEYGQNFGWLAVALAVLYSTGGITRLVAFTLDKTPIPGFFKGMPVPAGALLAIAPLEVLHQLRQYQFGFADTWRWWCLGIFFLSTCCMNAYFVRWRHVGRLMAKNSALAVFLLLLQVFVFTPFYGAILLLMCALYVLSPMVITVPKSRA